MGWKSPERTRNDSSDSSGPTSALRAEESDTRGRLKREAIQVLSTEPSHCTIRWTVGCHSGGKVALSGSIVRSRTTQCYQSCEKPCKGRRTRGGAQSNISVSSSYWIWASSCSKSPISAPPDIKRRISASPIASERPAPITLPSAKKVNRSPTRRE